MHLCTFRTAFLTALTGFVFAGIIGLTCVSPAVAAPTAAEKQAEAQEVLASLDAMQQVLDKASNDYFTALDEQQQAEAEAAAAQESIDEATEEILSMQDRLGSRARSMYIQGESGFLDLLLGATSWEDFTTRWSVLVDINRSDTEMIEQTKALRSQIRDQKAILDERTQTARDKAAEAEQIRQQAQETTEAMRATYDSLSAEAAALLEQEREAQRLAEEAAARAAAEEAAARAAAEEEARQAAEQAAASQEVSSSQGSVSSSETPSSTPPTVEYNPSTGNAIVDRAYSCLGADYVWGACSPGAFDCSGLVSYAVSGSYTRLGTTYTFLGWPQVSDPQPGDIAVNAQHCGVYIGNGQMIHAATEGVGVIIGGVQAGMIFVRP